MTKKKIFIYYDQVLPGSKYAELISQSVLTKYRVAFAAKTLHF